MSLKTCRIIYYIIALFDRTFLWYCIKHFVELILILSLNSCRLASRISRFTFLRSKLFHFLHEAVFRYFFSFTASSMVFSSQAKSVKQHRNAAQRYKKRIIQLQPAIVYDARREREHFRFFFLYTVVSFDLRRRPQTIGNKETAGEIVAKSCFTF